MLNIFSCRSNHPSPMKTSVWKIPVRSFMNAGHSLPILSKNLGQDNPTDIAGNPAAMKRTLIPCTLKNTSPIAKKGGCFKPASIGGNPSGTMQKSSSDEDIDTDHPEELLLFHADPEACGKAKKRPPPWITDARSDGGAPLADTKAEREEGTRQKNLSHPEKGSKMMIRNQWAEGKECAAGKFKNSWFT